MTKVEIVERKVFNKSVYEFRSDGMVIITVQDNSEIELEDCKAEFDFISQQRDYLPMVALVRPGSNTSVSREVKDYINTEECRALIKAEAIITNNLAHRLILNTMRKIYTQPINMKMFKTEEEGEEWLKQYL